MRELKVVETPSGIKVELKTYINGREFEEINDILYQQVNLSTGQTKVPNVNFTGSFVKKQTYKKIELIIVSVDGSNDNILDKILELKREDYIFVIKEINKVAGDEIDEGLNVEARKKKL